MADLNTAVTLIRTGQREEAQAILKEIIRTEPHNIPAWFWMVETLETDEDKLRVMEVCRKLNPEDTKVQKAYEMLKEVQATEESEKAAQAVSLEPVSEPAPVPGADQGVEKEIPAAPFADVPVIQAAPALIVPPGPEVEPPEEKEMSPVSFAAIPVIQNAPEQFQSKSEEDDKSAEKAAAAVAAAAVISSVNKGPEKSPELPPLEEKKEPPPFIDDKQPPIAAVAAVGAVAQPEPVPAAPPAQKPKRKRNWKWIIPAILISFAVFLCAGVSFIYIRQLFP